MAATPKSVRKIIKRAQKANVELFEERKKDRSFRAHNPNVTKKDVSKTTKERVRNKIQKDRSSSPAKKADSLHELKRKRNKY